MDDKVNLTIDGRGVLGRKGQTVLEVCRDNGMHVPTLCYHPKMPPYGGCRLCVVEIQNMRGFPTSCTTPAAEGMNVSTRTEHLLRLRKTILELLLAYGEHNCLFCEKNGEANCRIWSTSMELIEFALRPISCQGQLTTPAL